MRNESDGESCRERDRARTVRLDRPSRLRYHLLMDAQNRSHQSIAQLLREHDITPTRQRIVIASVLFERARHLSADQILDEVGARQAETSKATVYNTLRIFLDKGLIRELIVDPSKVYYDSNTSAHHHFFNIDTGELTDFSADGVTLAGLPPAPAGTVAAGVDIIIRTRRAD
jgi:Fur family transcriptional regulator, iron response regulator